MPKKSCACLSFPCLLHIIIIQLLEPDRPLDLPGICHELKWDKKNLFNDQFQADLLEGVSSEKLCIAVTFADLWSALLYCMV